MIKGGKMDKLSIAKVRNNTVMIHPDIVSLFDIYASHIRPLIDAHNSKIEANKVFFKPTLVIKKEKTWLMINNFELYYLLKMSDIDQKLVRKEVIIGSISEEQLMFGIPFYELIDIIAQHKKKLDIKLIYTCLNNLLTTSMSQELFNKKFFPITAFCRLININEQTYHKRPSESAS